MYLKMSSAICFSLNQSKILLSGNGLTHVQKNIGPCQPAHCVLGHSACLWMVFNYVFRNYISYIAATSASTHAFPEFLLTNTHTIFFPSCWLLSHITIVKTMVSDERGIILIPKGHYNYLPFQYTKKSINK